MNINNSKLTHFLSFVCVVESKVPRHAFLEATKEKKMKFCSWRRLETESYGRDRGKQNGAIVTLFNLITIFVVFKSRKEVVIKAFLNSRMFSSGVFIDSLALIRSYVWFYLLRFLAFLFICRGGWGGKAQCFILLTEFWQLLSLFYYIFFYCKFNITRFYICYYFLLLLFFISFIISRWIVLKLSSVLFRKCISYKANDRVSDVFHLPAVDHRIKRRIKEDQCQSVKL